MDSLMVMVSFILMLTDHCQGQPHCPLFCHCTYKEVNCSSRNLHVFPTNIESSCQILLAGGNNLQNVVLQQSLPQLHTLDLHHNQLRTFPNISSVATSLSILLLNKNDIGSLEGLQYAKELKELSVSDNRITELHAHWFKGLYNLEFLYMEKNQIRLIPGDCFKDLVKLTTLTLSFNLLDALNITTFAGLDSLAYLYLNDNNIAKVPTASLKALSSLKTVTLSGNPFKKFGRRDFDSINVKEMELTKLPHLFSVDKEAFYKMKKLYVLLLHHNPKLTYLDPDAFLYCSQLHALYVHNNNLLALDMNIVTSLAQLQIISLYHNRLHCDCNVHWIKEIINHTSSIDRNVTFQHAEKLICDTPLSMNAKLLQSVPITQIPTMCNPTVIPFFNDSHQRELGDSITYECRSIGVPRPHIHWILSNRKPVNNTSNDSRIRLETIGTLTVNHIKAIDSGTYTCVASNSIGCDTTSTVLHVHSTDIHIMHAGVATNFITLTWNGTGSTVSSSNYVIMYKSHGSSEQYKTIGLRPYMRKYTITNLRPFTVYEFCIAYQHREESVKLNCMDVKTKHELFMMEGLKTVNSLTVLIALSVATCLALIICLLTVAIRRYNRRKQYDEAEGFNICSKGGSSGKTVGNISQIPLDNLYKLNSTQLCSSTTSLISSTTTVNSNA